MFLIHLRRSAQLCVQDRDVIVELCEVKVAGDQLQVVIGNQLASVRLQSSLPGSVGGGRNVELLLSVDLLEDQEDVAMNPASLRRARTDVLNPRFAGTQITSRDVNNQPVTDF